MKNIRKSLLSNRVIRLLSSVTFGVSLLAVILVYASIGSALPQARGAIEMTEMEYFHHWVFAVLIVLFCVALTLATLLRVRWRVDNAGVLIVHTGLLTLTGGALAYFAGKVEGDVFLASPHLKISMPDDRVVDKVLALPGESWSTTAPALGGAVSVAVTDVSAGPVQPAARVDARIQVGGATRTVTLTPDDPPEPLAGGLTVAFEPATTQTHFYDDHQPTLYIRRGDEGDWDAIDIAGLPAFRERFLPSAGPILDANGTRVRAHRITPALNLGPLALPTGWFEAWRMPVRVDAAERPFDITINGYLPYIRGSITLAADGAARLNPAVNILPESAGRVAPQALFAFDPARAYTLAGPIPVEFRWLEDPGYLDAWRQPLAGTHELAVTTTEPATQQRLAVAIDSPAAIPGTDYVVELIEVIPEGEVDAAGFRGAITPLARVRVTRGDQTFTRVLPQRFPNLARDTNAAGESAGQKLLDPNIELRFRTAALGSVVLLATPGPDGNADLHMAQYRTDGSVVVRAVTRDERIPIRGGSRPMYLTVTGVFPRAVEGMHPIVEPVNRRRPNVALRSMSAIHLDIVGRGPLAGWRTQRWLLFSPYLNVDTRPLTLQPPNSETSWTFQYGRQRHDLGATLALRQLDTTMFPGEMQPTAWRSEFRYRPHGSDETREGEVYTNETYRVGAWTLFQSGADNERRWEWSILGVGNRRGINPMIIGSILVTVGLLYAFYVKPIIRRRQGAARQPAPRTTATDQPATPAVELASPKEHIGV
jgi:hypothetical protein